MTRQWAINGRFLTQPITGVQRYGREILSAIDAALGTSSALTEQLELELIVPSAAKDLPELRNILIRKFGIGHGHAWEQAVLPLAVRSGLISLCSTGPVSVSKQIVCVHDMNTRLLPESFSPQFRALYRVLIPAIGQRVEKISTVSHYSANQLVAFGVAERDKILVIGNGHEHVRRWRPEHSDTTRAAAGPDTVVVFGTGSPNKNLRLLLELTDDFTRNGLRLAIAGKIDPRVFGPGAEICESETIVCLGRVTDCELAALLQDSLCLAFPSFVEGFGLPPVEAMALGCPTLVSDTTCLPEICGDAALYASPNKPEAWLDQILRLRSNADLRTDLIARGRKRAQLYSWSGSARAYLEAMAGLDHHIPALSKVA